MNPVKFKFELILTVLCLFMVYSLATRDHGTVTYKVELVQPEMSTGAILPDKIIIPPNQDHYEAATKTTDQKPLTQLAQDEARHMIETGDVEKYQEELDKNGLLMTVLGY